MAREFQRGHKAKISDLTAGTDLYVGVSIAAPGLTFDISCFGLDAAEKLSDDRYFIFFNQPKSPEESIQLLGSQSGDTESFRVSLDRIPAHITKLSFTATIDGDGRMSQVGPGYIRIVAGGEEVARYPFTGAEFSTERAVMLADFYLKDVWRFAAVGQGFDGGLDALLRNFGGEVAEDQPAAAPPQAPAAPQAPAPAPAFAAPPPLQPVAQPPQAYAPQPGQPAPAPAFGGPVAAPVVPPAAVPPAATMPPGAVPPPVQPPFGQVPGQAPVQPPFGQVPGQGPVQPPFGQVPGQAPVQPPFGQAPGQAPVQPPFGQAPGQGPVQPPFGQVPGQMPGAVPPPGTGAFVQQAPFAYGQTGVQGQPAGIPQGVPAAGAGLNAALQAYRETPTGQRWTPQNQHLMRVDVAMGGTGVLARSGSMVMYQGKIDFGHKSGGFVGRVVGNATGQEMQLMRCTGRGQIFLAEDNAHLHPIELQGDAICVSAENVLAFDESLQYEVRRIEGHGIPGGVLFTLQFQGTGTVVVKTHGTPVILPVTAATFADTNAIVAWSAAAQVKLASQVRLRRNSYPGHSGETVNLQFRGAPGNFIVVQPYEV
ncbi:TerD family protein [Streptomyces qinzhouensis]|uniref:Stress protein n=1 Tax=Streptomyces qinzhouensis TaxID=2599401 RepID=A0A5B8IKC2_9ACTN|nr:TerD family protein [Streptomyces qinzhouensis]QDY78922.1 stress protein [Streptomyces qinzhouensis]